MPKLAKTRSRWLCSTDSTYTPAFSLQATRADPCESGKSYHEPPRPWPAGLAARPPPAVSACGEPYQAPDSGCRDANVHDAGTFADAYTYRLPLTDPIGECLPADEAECGCIDGFRRCDTCGWCPTDFACDESAGVCRGLDDNDFLGPSGRTWFDSCGIELTSDGERGVLTSVGTSYCHTGKVCAAGPLRAVNGCYPVSFCQAAAVAEPPVEDLHSVYSDGRPVIDGPPATGACPVGVPRQPYCGGVCGDDLRCLRFRGIQACVAFSEQRAFGVCASDVGVCVPGQEMYNDGDLRQCELDSEVLTSG